jgi:quercetin dioxygenase-like cupin family protein
MKEKRPIDQLTGGSCHRVADLVSVADSAIVSRVLARTRGGSVTLFAFAAGQELSEHTAPFDALVHVIEGRLEITIGGNAVDVSGGMVVLMPADIPHALAAAEDSKMLLTMLKETGEE